MILLEKICEELGVDIGERWTGSDGYDYKITEEGLIGFYYPTSDNEENFDADTELWVNIILGELRPKWRPEVGQTYYIPYIHSKEEERQLNYIWEDGRRTDKFLWDNNLVFKTKEEAIEATNKMLKYWRGE